MPRYNLINMEKKAINLDLDQQYFEKLENIIFQPVFIMGVQRSGTSILYKLLTATQLFNPVTAYHMIRYPELIHNHINNQERNAKNILAEFLKDHSQSDRGIDGLKITPDFPEEYGFLLGQKTEQAKLTPKNLPVFIELCKKIQFISDPKKPILLKNPWDFSNFIYIKQVFPTAKFIFIHRNPIKTLTSQIKAMRLLLQNKSTYMAMLSPWYNQLFDCKVRLYCYQLLYSSYIPIRSIQVVRRMAKNTNYFLENINKLDKTDYINITYENLCQQPETVITNILKFLAMPPPHQINYHDYIKPRKTNELNELKMIKKTILKKLHAYMSYCGYTNEEMTSSQNESI